MAAAYFHRLAAACVRGSPEPEQPLPAWARRGSLEELSDEQCRDLCDWARGAGIRIHAFKRAAELPRVRKVLGILRGLAPASVLDLGSGRGVSLWPLVDAFPGAEVVAVDRDIGRLRRIQAVRRGGVRRLAALRADVSRLCVGDHRFDVVTLLEVLEHVREPSRVLAEALRAARRFLVLSVPSKEDDNPEHLHLFTGDELRTLLREAGAARVSVEYVLNHLVVVVRSAHAG